MSRNVLRNPRRQSTQPVAGTTGTGTHPAVLAIARLLARQLAREAVQRHHEKASPGPKREGGEPDDR